MKQETMDEHETQSIGCGELGHIVYYFDTDKYWASIIAGNRPIPKPVKGGDEMRTDPNLTTGMAARQARDVYGHGLETEPHHRLGDKLVGWAALIITGILIGWATAGVIYL